MADTEVVRTGIRGLDEVFLGGIARGNVTLVEGRPGTGKTMVGTAFICRGAEAYDEPGIIVCFETNPQKLIRDAGSVGLDLAALQAQNRVKVIFTTPQLLAQQLRSPDSLLLEAAAEMGAERIFIDGISLLHAIANGNGANGNGHFSYREILQQLIEGLQRENLSSMLSCEIISRPDQTSTLEITEFLADTVIVLECDRKELTVHRTLEISKSRGQDFDYGKHTLVLSSKGPEVFRRVQARPRDPESQPTSTKKRSVIGWDAFDALMDGGLYPGSTTMVVGVSGAGKTILGSQVLLEGAIKQGQKALMISLDEHPAQIIRNAETVGLNLGEQVEAGNIIIYFESPQELQLDVHFHKIRTLVEENNVDRLLIDGLTSYTTATENERTYRDFFHTVVGYTKRRLMTTFFSYETPELFGLSTFMPEFGVSSVVDNIILLNLVELGNTLHRAMTVAKARGTKHQFETREFTIGQGGINLLPRDEAAQLPILPFGSYFNILSRAPTRFSPNIRGTAREDER